MSTQTSTIKKAKSFDAVRLKQLGIFLLSAFMAFLAFQSIIRSMAIVEVREGIVLSDFVHDLLPPPQDFSTIIFAVTYFSAIISILLAIFEGLRKSSLLLFGYSTVILLRSFTLLVFPLDPPDGMIPLIDSFVVFCTPDSFVATRDLFFSGHMASLFIFYMIAKPKWLKKTLLVMNILMAVALSWQRVHYTVDIVVAVIVAYAVGKFYIYMFDKYYPKTVDQA